VCRYPDIRSFETHDEAHGRIEHRFVRALPIGALPARTKSKWIDLKTAVLVERIRAVDSVTLERAYYVTSHRADPKLLSRLIRDHWSIENQLHHCLDVSFAEDRRRIRHENGAQNFALITRYALSLIKRERTKMSVAMKRRRAAWGATYLLDILVSGFADL
jgi:predicted transposase YbfD/YdcC